MIAVFSEGRTVLSHCGTFSFLGLGSQNVSRAAPAIQSTTKKSPTHSQIPLEEGQHGPPVENSGPGGCF